MRTMNLMLQVDFDDDDCLAVDKGDECEEELMLWYVGKFIDDPEKINNVRVVGWGESR